jgi:CheY-like chemotaxis protein/anti-sigma regulatory factor (Ser/Thr protein kinase)
MNRILVAEDSPQQCEGIRLLLERAGFFVDQAHDGFEAMHKLRRGHFDLVVMDVWMPGLNGLDLLEILRESSKPPKVVVLTGDHAPETLLRAMRDQVFRYVLKPIDPKGLVEIVRQAVEATPDPTPIQVISARPDFVELEVPCTLDVVQRIQSFVLQLEAHLAPEIRKAIGLAFRELLQNAIEWGGRLDPAKTVRISCLRTSRMLLYRIADPGKGFRFEDLTHAAVHYPDQQPEAHLAPRAAKGLRPGGLGILMAKKVVDDLIYNEAQNEVVFVKYLNEPGRSK